MDKKINNYMSFLEKIISKVERNGDLIYCQWLGRKGMYEAICSNGYLQVISAPVSYIPANLFELQTIKERKMLKKYINSTK